MANTLLPVAVVVVVVISAFCQGQWATTILLELVVAAPRVDVIRTAAFIVNNYDEWRCRYGKKLR